MQSTLIVCAVVATSAVALRSGYTGADAYEAFRADHGVQRPRGSIEEYLARVALFEQRHEEVKNHNAQTGQLWKKAINKFADFTAAEFQGLLGHRLSRRNGRADIGAKTSSFLESGLGQELADFIDLRGSLNASLAAKDQGGCGSCWAVATAGALETHAESHGLLLAQTGQAVAVPRVSYEQMVDCVQNPDHCGGTGGCSGATSELSLEYTHLHGIAAEHNYAGYQHGGDGTCRERANPVITTSGFVRLPENKVQPMLQALNNHGSVIVSADASLWSLYSQGVFDSCRKDGIVNHAILMMGYGTDNGTPYWLIRNSWGPVWGEAGFIRLLRHTEDNAYCGIDTKPGDGVGCTGGPSELPVCGMCAILSDSTYPTGVTVHPENM